MSRTTRRPPRAANNGALPPDLSLIVNAREGGPDYVYGILTGFGEPPPGFKMQDGMNYNKYFPGHQIAMPQPLQDGQVTYADGTKASVDRRRMTSSPSWPGPPTRRWWSASRWACAWSCSWCS